MTIDGVRVDGQARTAPLSRTLRLVRPVRRKVGYATVLGACAVLADIGLLGTAAWLISRAAQHPNESALALAIAAVQVFGLTRGLFRYGERLVGHDAAFRLLAGVRVRIYRRLERLAPSGLPAFRRGDLLARMVSDVDSLQDLPIRIVPAFGIAALVGTITVAVMWWLLPVAALVLGVALVLAATLVPWFTSELARRRESRFAAARGDLGVAILDLTEGAAELVAFGATAAQVHSVHERDDELTAVATASASTSGIGIALTTLLTGVACWGCLVVGVLAVRSGGLAGTDLAVVTLIPLAAFELVAGLPVATQVLHRVRQAAGRVFDVMDMPAPVAEPELPLTMPSAPYSLVARSVWAAYPGSNSPAIRGVDLAVAAGQRLAIVGPSGAGKSTIAAILLRFMECQSGTVDLNGVPMTQLPGDEIRTVVGLVGQDAYLFDTTIRANLAVGRRDATEAELRAAIDRVGLGGWLDGLPLGLDTEVGRHGARLSGGQRQRVAVARALLADFPILILDEPAEHLEPAAADAMTADLLAATAGRAVVLITHRLAGLESIDEILVMDAGQIVERGSHNVLLARGGRYSALWWEERYAEGDASRGEVAAETSPDRKAERHEIDSRDDQ